ncbi:hypothetical protein Tco_1119318 [Tanacetum coccineum]
MSHTNLSQEQTGSSQQPSQEIQEEEDETEPVPTPTSKKPGSRGKRVKTIAKKTSGSNPAMFQEMMQQQLEIERKEKMKRIDRECSKDGNKTRTRWGPDLQTRIDWGIPELTRDGDGDGESPNYETDDGAGKGIT